MSTEPEWCITMTEVVSGFCMSRAQRKTHQNWLAVSSFCVHIFQTPFGGAFCVELMPWDLSLLIWFFFFSRRCRLVFAVVCYHGYFEMLLLVYIFNIVDEKCFRSPYDFFPTLRVPCSLSPRRTSDSPMLPWNATNSTKPLSTIINRSWRNRVTKSKRSSKRCVHNQPVMHTTAAFCYVVKPSLVTKPKYGTS